MKTYKLKSILSVICFIIAGFCLAMAIICAVEWDATSESIIGSIMSIAYFIIGLCAKKGSQEDHEDYINTRKSIKETYFELSHLYKKYYWVLDIDSLVPSLKNKKKLLEWLADTAVACQVYQHDYNTATNDPDTNLDLELIINLSQELIDNKKDI